MDIWHKISAYILAFRLEFTKLLIYTHIDSLIIVLIFHYKYKYQYNTLIFNTYLNEISALPLFRNIDIRIYKYINIYNTHVNQITKYQYILHMVSCVLVHCIQNYEIAVEIIK